MSTPARTISSTASLAEAARQMGTWHVGSLVVSDGGEPTGMVTDRDVALHALLEDVDPESCPVSSCASSPLIAIPEGMALEHAAEKMRTSQVRRLAVADDDGDLAGVLTADDLLERIGSAIAGLAEAVRLEVSQEAVSESEAQTTIPYEGAHE